LAVKSRLWKIVRILLYVVASLLVIFLFGVVPWFLTNIITTAQFHFRDPDDGKTPQSYGMEFHPVEFHSSDGILLKGWYIPASGEARGTIIYCHGLNRTRIEMLPMAVFAHSLGYNGLLLDLRHQGESEGAVKSLGYWERLDAEAAVHYALTEEKAARPVILWGVSMGAATALLAAADSPDVAAVISDSSFLNYTDVIRHHYYLFRGFVRWFPPLPSFPIADEVIHWSAWRANFDPVDFDLEKAVMRIGDRPVLFVAVEGDRRMPPSIAQKLYADAQSPLKELVVVPGTRHGEGFKSGNQQYEGAVTHFLASLPAAGGAGSADLRL
jgi:alpha-beta hydrolase superfamily lysophospholipase